MSALMVLPIGFFSMAVLLFGNIGQNTVVQRVESPSKQYYAQVVDRDQGALGGDTLVDVYERNGINMTFFQVKKKPQRVYVEEWGEYESMEVHWKNDKTLMMNSMEYTIE